EDVQANGEDDAERTLSDPYVFRELDRLTVLGPVSDITLGRPTERKTDKDDKSNITSELELVATQGKEIGGSLTVLRQKLDPHVLETLNVQGVKGVGFIEAKDLKSRKRSEVSEAAANETVQYVVLATGSEDGETSLVRKVTDNKLEETTAPDFNSDNDTTIDIGSLCEGGRIVQVLKGEVRSYDKTLGLSQIYPVWDEDTSEEKHVVAVTFADPYVALIRDDGSVLLLQADESGDLDEVPVEGVIESNKWLWASLYADHEHFLSPTSQDHKNQILLFLLDTEGKLYVSEDPRPRVARIKG
ncbi:mRNA cleavage and polyadenylation factor subunit, partial [Ascosphaera atra]